MAESPESTIRTVAEIDRARIDSMPEAKLRQALKVALNELDIAWGETAELEWMLHKREETHASFDRHLDLLTDLWKGRPNHWRDSEDWRRVRDFLIDQGRI